MSFANYAALVNTLYDNKVHRPRRNLTPLRRTNWKPPSLATMGTTKIPSATPRAHLLPSNRHLNLYTLVWSTVSSRPSIYPLCLTLCRFSSASWCLYCGEFIWSNLNPGFRCKGTHPFAPSNCQAKTVSAWYTRSASSRCPRTAAASITRTLPRIPTR